MSLPLLYSGTRNASSWAMRAWLALREAGVEFDEIVVDIRRPLRFPSLRALSSFSPAATVPLLVAEGRILFDSLAIMEFANDWCEGALLPGERDHSRRGSLAPRVAACRALENLLANILRERILSDQASPHGGRAARRRAAFRPSRISPSGEWRPVPVQRPLACRSRPGPDIAPADEAQHRP
jgi:glutathione S-transferase